MSRVEVLETPVKSQGDLKEYRLIRLKNGLKALLVSNAYEDPNDIGIDLIAAAGLTVKVASFDDPSKALGLAHFLEHMVHMGTKKYPEESGYYDFLTSHGGFRNANTGSEFTSYYFGISEKAFPEALDRFGQMMESPLLLKNSMQREREAVDSEFNMQKSLDIAGFQGILKSLINPTHPASQFDFGNLKTLKDNISDDELHRELLKLHTKYVANKMYLAVQSNRSLNELQELVEKSFSGIKRGDQGNDNLPHIPPKLDQIFKPEFYNKIYYMRPKTAMNALFLSWTLPSVSNHYKCSPLDYISYLFLNDGEGGIGNYLKERHYSTGIGIIIKVNEYSSNADFTLAQLYVELTVTGRENIDKVLEAIASYLLMIKETPFTEHRRIYQDLKEKSEIDFNFYREATSLETVSEISTNMLLYNEDDTLRGNSVLQEFDEEIISQCINALNERKFNLLVTTDIYENFDKVEKYFGSEYAVENFPEAYEKIWQEKKRILEFAMEKPNPYKTTNFEIFANEAESTKYPVKLLETSTLKVWHTLDNKYLRPFVFFRLHLFSPVVARTTENYLTMSIFNKVLKSYMYKKISQATNAGYDVTSSTDRSGLTITFEGYVEKMSMVIEAVTGFVSSCMNEVDEDTFEISKEQMIEYYANLLVYIDNLNSDFMDKTLLNIYFSPFDVLVEFDSISYNSVKSFISNFLQNMKMEILAQGNITKDQTLAVVKIIQNNLKCEPFIDIFEPVRRCYHLPVGTSVIRIKSLLTNDDNSIFKNHYQVGRDTLRARCFTRIIEAILSPKAFDYLRTKEQLGYTVDLQLVAKGNAIAIELVVSSQEHKHPFTEVSRKMDLFMNEIAKAAMEELSDADFESVKQARLERLLAEHLDLTSESKSNWHEIKLQEYVFNRLELAAKITETITKSDLQEFFKSFTQPDNMRRLCVHVIGNLPDNSETADEPSDFEIKYLTDKLTEEENIITNIENFRNELYLFTIEGFQK